jgi:hypothetical protein
MQPPFFCDYATNIELGERVFDSNCVVLDVCRVRVGEYTLFGPAVQIYTPMHPFDAGERRREEFGKPIDIGSDVWAGGGAIILAGVRIGARAVIDAGSVVTRDGPDAVFAVGNPCRVVREIGSEGATSSMNPVVFGRSEGHDRCRRGFWRVTARRGATHTRSPRCARADPSIRRPGHGPVKAAQSTKVHFVAPH